MLKLTQRFLCTNNLQAAYDYIKLLVRHVQEELRMLGIDEEVFTKLSVTGVAYHQGKRMELDHHECCIVMDFGRNYALAVSRSGIILVSLTEPLDGNNSYVDINIEIGVSDTAYICPLIKENFINRS